MTLACAAEGDPTPVIRWRKKKLRLDQVEESHLYNRKANLAGYDEEDGFKWEENLPAERTRMQEGNLTISGLVLRDAGEYECRAENVVTAIVATVNLIIEVSEREWRRICGWN